MVSLLQSFYSIMTLLTLIWKVIVSTALVEGLPSLEVCKFLFNNDWSLLTSIRKVIVSTAHIVVLSFLELQQHPHKRSWSVIELRLHGAGIDIIRTSRVTSDVPCCRELESHIFCGHLWSTWMARVGPNWNRFSEHGLFVECEGIVGFAVGDLDDVVTVSTWND